MKFRLRPWLVLVFVALVVPVFGVVLAFNYLTAERVAHATADNLVERALYEATAGTRELIRPLRTAVRAAASLASAQPEFMRSPAGATYLGELLALSDSVASTYVAFPDGAFRGVLRLQAGVPVEGLLPPDQARLARVRFDPDSGGRSVGQVEFVDAQGRRISAHDVSSDFDPRTRTWWRSSRESGSLTLSDPYVFAATGEVGVTVSAPFGPSATAAGVVGADITLSTISRLMTERRVSPRAESFLVDEQGRVLAHTQAGQVPADAGRTLPGLGSLGGEHAVAALSLGRQSQGRVFVFDHERTGEPTAAVTVELGEAMGRPWELLAMAPLSDFSGALREANQRILLLGLGALLLQAVIILALARRMAEPMERLAARVDRVRAFRRDEPQVEASALREIDTLARAVGTLQATINAFAAYMPISLVRQLVQNGQAIKPGGENRFLSLMFTDLEGFSALSERLTPQTLLEQVSAYFGCVTEAVESEQGTLDKFIGDGAMAFWGAPIPVDNHALRACMAALRIRNGLAALNRQWIAQGLKPLKVRIGLHCDSVMVGNIGSDQRMNYTVLGDGVNVAAYMETANKSFGTLVCVSQAVIREAGHRLCVRPLNRVSVKTRQSGILVYELLGVYEAAPELAPDDAAIELSRLTAIAWDAFQQGQSEAARAAYQAVLEYDPDDSVARHMLQMLA